MCALPFRNDTHMEVIRETETIRDMGGEGITGWYEYYHCYEQGLLGYLAGRLGYYYL